MRSIPLNSTYKFSASENSTGLLVAKSTIQNIEHEQLVLERYLIEYLVDDPDAKRLFGSI
jgi:hypothetical protein